MRYGAGSFTGHGHGQSRAPRWTPACKAAHKRLETALERRLARRPALQEAYREWEAAMVALVSQEVETLTLENFRYERTYPAFLQHEMHCCEAALLAYNRTQEEVLDAARRALAWPRSDEPARPHLAGLPGPTTDALRAPHAPGWLTSRGAAPRRRGRAPHRSGALTDRSQRAGRGAPDAEAAPPAAAAGGAEAAAPHPGGRDAGAEARAHGGTRAEGAAEVAHGGTRAEGSAEVAHGGTRAEGSAEVAHGGTRAEGAAEGGSTRAGGEGAVRVWGGGSSLAGGGGRRRPGGAACKMTRLMLATALDASGSPGAAPPGEDARRGGETPRGAARGLAAAASIPAVVLDAALLRQLKRGLGAARAAREFPGAFA